MNTELERSESAIIIEGQTIFNDLIPRIREEVKHQIGNPPELDSQILLLTYRVAHFWCMDAILRLVQEAAPNQDAIDWGYTLKALSLSVRRFDVDLLVRVAVKSQDVRSVVDLIKMWIAADEYQREIKRRLASFRFSEPFLRYLRRTSGVTELADLFNVTANQIKAWIRRFPKKQITYADSQLLRALKLDSYDVTSRNARSAYIRNKAEELHEIRQDALLVIHNLYHEFQIVLAPEIDRTRVNSALPFGDPVWEFDGETLQISSNPIIARHPFTNPLWEEKLRTHLLNQIDKMNKVLPLIDGSMEIAPLKVYDHNRTQGRRKEKEYQNKRSYDELNDQECNSDDEGDAFPLSKLEFKHLMDSGFTDQIDPVDLINAQEEFDQRLQNQTQKVNPPRKRAQVCEAIRSIVFYDRSAKDAAQLNNVSEKTVSKYRTELGF